MTKRFLVALALASVVCFVEATSYAALVGYWSFDGDADADFGGWGPSTQRNGGNSTNDISFPTDVPTEINGRVSQSIAFADAADDDILTGFDASDAGISGGTAAEVHLRSSS
jgi:hypothetical protein